MTKNYLKTLLLLLLLPLGKSYAQVGVGTASPDPSSVLDVTSANGGMLVPRISLTGISDVTTITAPATSLLVYNTGFAPNGYYYWSGLQWIQLTTGTNNWSLLGNLGTSAGTSFIGTTDAQDIRFKTNSTDRWNISHTNNGQLQSWGLGTNALPAYSFQGQQSTGIFGAATDVLGFSTAGTERMRIDNIGNIGIGTIPTASSILDLSSIATKAMEVPNVALVATNSPSPITAPATGALVYNTATASSGTTAVAPGYYYWNGSAWLNMTTSGQTATSYFTTAGGSFAAAAGLSYLPGFPQTITVPANSDVLLSGDIGLQVNSNVTTGFSVSDVLLIVDGSPTTNAGYQRIYVTNNGGVVFNVRYATFSQAFTLTAGAHTIGFAAAGAGLGGSAAIIGGDSNSVLQGELTATFIKR